LLGGPYQFGLGGPGGWFFLYEQELHFGPRKDILVPDLAGWRRERYTDELAQATFITSAPDWVCEVLSPATERLDRTKKLKIYAREQVTHVWLIDPVVNTLEIYQLEGGRYFLVETVDESVPRELEPFGPFRLDLLWPPLVSLSAG
jgi:Uma2 family endonuclease